MANWCSNTLVFTSGNFLPFKQEIIDSIGSNEGLRIFGEDSMCIFDACGTIEDDYINFESRWTPPLVDLVKRAEKDGFEFEIEYSEQSYFIFGKATYVDGCFNDTCLPECIFDAIEYNDDGEASVNGEPIDSVDEYLEEQLSLIC